MKDPDSHRSDIKVLVPKKNLKEADPKVFELTVSPSPRGFVKII